MVLNSCSFFNKIFIVKYNREFITEKAFEVFMNKGYDSTSISVLQSELSMSRGAMYRYFINKEELFISVIDKYVLDLINRLLFREINDLTVPNLIGKLYRHQMLYLNLFNKARVNHSIMLNYTALIIQATKYYPGFIHKFYLIHRRFNIIWKLAIRKSIMIEEIKPNTDIELMSQLFTNIFFQEIVSEYPENRTDHITFNEKMKRDLDKRKEMLEYLYRLVHT